MPYPWFRVYSDILHNPKMRRLAPAQRWYWIGLLALANECPTRGRLEIAPGMPYTAGDVARALDAPPRQVEESLALFRALRMIHTEETAGGPAIVVSNWEVRQYDPGALRVQKHRLGKSLARQQGGAEGDALGNAVVTPPQRPGNAEQAPDAELEADLASEREADLDISSPGREGSIAPSLSNPDPSSPGVRGDAPQQDAPARCPAASDSPGEGARGLPVAPPRGLPVASLDATPARPPSGAPGSPPGAAPVSSPRNGSVAPLDHAPVSPPSGAPGSPPGATPVSSPRNGSVAPPDDVPGSLPVAALGDTPARPLDHAPGSPPSGAPVAPPGDAPLAPISATQDTENTLSGAASDELPAWARPDEEPGAGDPPGDDASPEDEPPAGEDPGADEDAEQAALGPPQHKSWRIEDKIADCAEVWAPGEDPEQFVRAVFKLWKKTRLDETHMFRAVTKAVDVTRLRLDKGLIHSAGYMRYMLAVLRNEVLPRSRLGLRGRGADGEDDPRDGEREG